MSLLSVTHEAAGRTAVVRPEGRLDVRAYPELRDTLLKHAAEIPDALVVDLSGLTADRVTTLSVFPTVWLRISSWPDIPMALAAAGAELSALLEALLERVTDGREGGIAGSMRLDGHGGSMPGNAPALLFSSR